MSMPGQPQATVPDLQRFAGTQLGKVTPTEPVIRLTDQPLPVRPTQQAEELYGRMEGRIAQPWRAVPPTAPVRAAPPTAPVAERILPESVVTGMREGRSAKALPSVDSLQDNYRKPLSGYTDRLFHETSIDSARGFLLRGNSNQQDIFFANSADMARGQGGTGVLIEFDPGLMGREIEGCLLYTSPSPRD